MNEDLYKVLLYFDGSRYSLSAAVYTANLFNRLSNMSLTILHVQETIKGARPEDYNLMELWSAGPNLEWKNALLEKEESDQLDLCSKLFTKLNEVFWGKGLSITQEVIFANPTIPDTVEAIIEYATKKNFELIIMGTRGPSSLKGLMYGSLAHSVLNKSHIPVLLIKKLPQEFIDHFCADLSEESKLVRKDHLYLAKTM
ncbi:universal stress protein [Desulfosporosinus youngiae]|uniref:Universal stress protein UspA-like protein n=1 Tax=Desulfosporosinus youngiae DSM 17734 TaxID=768710 RepID=H5XSS3_9FIRM|nr:universal stress protein [Desulfosporosinus youngiae]EHQ87741.1 universal stress protein UspA-like protein [Desulfosporosinus youngiae DSM 17734]